MKRKLLIENVSKQFKSNHRLNVNALEKVSFEVKAGEFVCFIGMSGCGKTTLLRMIAGLEVMDQGRIFIGKEPLSRDLKDTALVFQQYSLFPWLSVQENICFPLGLKGLSKKDQYLQSDELLELVGLIDFKKAYPYELSGGMQQRVAIARALAYDPDIILMDEPFGALDERTRHKLQELVLFVWKKKKKTILFVTHNIDEAITLSDRIFVMTKDPGRIIDEIEIRLPRPRSRLNKAFIDLHLKLRRILDRYEH